MVRPSLILALTAFFSVPAVAQAPTAGANPMMQMCSALLGQSGQIAADGQRLCACLVREVPAKLSDAEMQLYDRSNAAGQPLPDALQAKITGIAVQCLAAAR